MTDAVLKYEGLKVLDDHFGPVDMERFLVMISREQNDYTKWHEQNEDTLSVREFSKKAMDHQSNTEK
ncbi:hypothetical protein AGMMS50212_03960 [Spirochaetia bacterium]|nr:hypothetical protein AGMMS50212_03960 [Spirochaetia bacterium]